MLDYHHKLRSPLDFASSPSKEKHLGKNTPEWINHPGPRTSRQSNIHPKTPDPARLEELSKVKLIMRLLITPSFLIVLILFSSSSFRHRKNGMNGVPMHRHRPHPSENHFDGSNVKTISIVGLVLHLCQQISPHIGTPLRNRIAKRIVEHPRSPASSYPMNECISCANRHRQN